ncbi:SusC/RagA family TonB-linked outer membrane protein [Pedobacter sp. GSP4]|uniref:SusC/RagA family TonB-linked outer membrane protein n=1 Tax=Pedobacter sp. GSP4 TaxID=3453716 RepID=UPI003EEBA192
MKRQRLTTKMLFLCILILLVRPVMAQQKEQISGKTVDEKNETLVGVTVQLIAADGGSPLTTVSNDKGMFSFSGLKNGAKYTLRASYVGYRRYEEAGFVVNNNQSSSILIKLEEEGAKLSEVVVVGYGTQQKKFVTGSLSSVKGEQLGTYAGSNFAQQLSGKSAGVVINDISAQPGADPKIIIRGIGTLTAGTNPLIVVDGFPLSEGSSLNSINPNDIESMDILKDAASAAIYGSRAANGVILITTKKGKNEQTKISLDVYTGFQQRADQVEYANAYEAAKFLTSARDNGYITKSPSNRSITDDRATRLAKGASLRELRLNYLQPYLDGVPGLTNTNWLDEIFRTAPMSSYNLSFAGGNAKTNFYGSANYLNQQGLVINNGLQRYSVNFKVNSKISDQLDFGFSINPSYNLQKVFDNNGGFDDPLGAAAAMYPFFSPYNSDGSLAISQQIIANTSEDGALVENPVASLNRIKNNRTFTRVFGNTFISYKFFKDLTYKLSIGGDYSSKYFDYYNPTDVGAYRTAVVNKLASASETNGAIWNYLIEHTLNYAKILGKHDFNVLGGYTFQKENGTNTIINGTNIADDNIRNINGASSFALDPSSGKYRWTQISYFARLQYMFNQKYIASLTFRTDGSSRFGQSNQWGTFPSVTTGWIFSKEEFFPQNSFISFGKLRATWGKSGNNQIGNYGSKALVTGGASSNYVFGNVLAPGFSAATTANTNLSWETKTSYNLGLDLEILRKVNLTAEYYNTETKDLLLNVPIPYQSGFKTSLQNIGKMRNNGFELNISANHIKLGEVNWDINGNMSYNKNKVLALAPGQTQIIAGTVANIITKVGQPLAEIYGYHVTGVFKTPEQLNNLPKLPGTLLGDYIVEDTNGDKIIDQNDWRPMGSYFPKFSYGLSNNFTWKNFNLGFSISAISGRTIYAYELATREESGEGFTLPSKYYYDNAYDPVNNPSGTLAQPNFGNFSPARRSTRASDVFYKSGDYVRLRDAQIGYTFSDKLLKKVGIASAKIYISGNNLITLNDFRGFNPEGSQESILASGENSNNYPVARTYLLGCNITF